MTGSYLKQEDDETKQTSKCRSEQTTAAPTRTVLLWTWGLELESGSQAVAPTHICSTLPLPPPPSSRLSPSLLLPCFFSPALLPRYDAEPQLFLQKESSKLGPSIRQQDRGLRPEQEPSGQGTGLSGQDIPRPLTASSTLRPGVPARRARQSHSQSLGMLLLPTEKLLSPETPLRGQKTLRNASAGGK